MSLSMWELRHGLKEPARRIGRRLDRLRYPAVFADQLSDAAAAAWITQALLDRDPVCVGRLGAVESRLMGEAAYGQMWRAAGSFSGVTLRQAHCNAGIFPAEASTLSAVVQRMKTALESVDLLAVWECPHQPRLVQELIPRPLLCSLTALEPWWQCPPWSGALAGLRVLVVHPFAASIQRQWRFRERLFDDPQVLPPFELQTIRPPFTLAGQTEGFASWIDALDALIERVHAAEFDVALLGCGAYGLPLAAAIKAMGRPALQLGGALQLLFGIRGRRWESMPRFAALMHHGWVRPLPEETPQQAARVDGGCYW